MNRVKPEVVLAVLSELARAYRRAQATPYAAQEGWLAQVRRLRRALP